MPVRQLKNFRKIWFLLEGISVFDWKLMEYFDYLNAKNHRYHRFSDSCYCEGRSLPFDPFGFPLRLRTLGTSSGLRLIQSKLSRRIQNLSRGMATICSTWRMEKRPISDGGECLLHWKTGEHFAPLAGVSHVRQIETPVRHVCKSRKAVFEKRR